MLHKRSLVTFFSGAAVVAALLLSGCSSDKSSSASTTTSSSSSQATSPAAPAGTVNVANTGLGKVLVDSQGRTLYLFLKDTGTTSECSDACAAAWPPLETSSTPTAANGAEASLVGTTTRADGTTQVTYNGHPVYLFQGDTKAGDTSGQGVVAFGAGWFAISPAGDQVAGSGSSTSGTSGSGGGSGY